MIRKVMEMEKAKGMRMLDSMGNKGRGCASVLSGIERCQG